MSIKKLSGRWLVGLLVGTAIVAFTSPLFVRSYLPKRLDSVRGEYVPVSGLRYRWRSEGYASTWIGQHGMPGRREVPPKQAGVSRVALWGDSQAEGICLPDDQKLFAQIEKTAESAGQRIEVLPLARSGDDASHCLAQIPAVERSLRVDAHLLMIFELRDLVRAIDGPSRLVDNGQVLRDRSKIAGRLPAFVIHAVRNLVTDPDGGRRKLRFTIGPTRRQQRARAEIPAEQSGWAAIWPAAMARIRAVSKQPILIVYAPRSPHISGGKIVLHDWQDEQFQSMERAARKAGVSVVDARAALADAARQGRWPHGFHNGQIGDGHLNAVGNEVIALTVVNFLAAHEPSR
jgi:hypothetical protein